MEQTAVEWLVEQFNLEMHDDFHLTKINQAKEMEKQQAIDFACEIFFGGMCISINLRNFITSKYETFKSE